MLSNGVKFAKITKLTPLNPELCQYKCFCHFYLTGLNYCHTSIYPVGYLLNLKHIALLYKLSNGVYAFEIP